MSKLKLLLLWWIFTLVWIFNFSSANIIENFYYDSVCNFTCTYWDCCKIPYDKIYSLSCTTVFGSVNRVRIYTNPNSFSWYNCWVVYNFPDWLPVYQITASTDVPSRFPILSYKVKWNSVWVFTPAVNWVKTTVNQIIPLMVYIWIGVLVVTLWFIAIRWLVNWMSNWIKSKFSSKRG